MHSWCETIDPAPKISDDPKADFYPLVSPDSRTIYWETGRRELERMSSVTVGSDNGSETERTEEDAEIEFALSNDPNIPCL